MKLRLAEPLDDHLFKPNKVIDEIALVHTLPYSAFIALFEYSPQSAKRLLHRDARRWLSDSASI